MVGRAPTMRISPRRRQPADPPHGEGSLDMPRARRCTAAATLEPRSTDAPPRLPGGGGSRSCSQPACASSPPPDHGKGGLMRMRPPPRLPRGGVGGRRAARHFTEAAGDYRHAPAGGLPARGWRPHLLRLAPASREGGGIRSALLAASRKRPAAGPQAHGRGGLSGDAGATQHRRDPPPPGRRGGPDAARSRPAPAVRPQTTGKGASCGCVLHPASREGGGRPPRRPPLHGSGWRLPARAGGRPPRTRVEAALVASCPRLPGGGGQNFAPPC
jgi:hypothetical protein